MESTIASMTKEEVLKISLTCGKLLLTSGAETYRVEDTMTRICALRDMQIAAVSTPSWIMVGDETVDGTSMVSRVTRRGTGSHPHQRSEQHFLSYAHVGPFLCRNHGHA